MEWLGKPIRLSKKGNVYNEVINLGLEPEDILDILYSGLIVRKREKGVVEKWLPKGRWIYNAVVVDQHTWWLLIHVGRFTKNKKKMNLIKGLT